MKRAKGGLMPTLTQFIERLTFSKFQSTLSRMLMIAKMNLINDIYLRYLRICILQIYYGLKGDAFGLFGFLKTTQRITAYGGAARVPVCFGLASDRHPIGSSIRRLACWRSCSVA